VNEAFLNLFFTLLGLHFLADYPLQGAYLSAMKNSHSDDGRWLGSRAWVQGLLAHSGIHGLFVGLATGSLVLGLAETAAHLAIDFMKGRRLIGSVTDQLLHVSCKAFWVIWALHEGWKSPFLP
jgi:hypothetical protein